MITRSEFRGSTDDVDRPFKFFRIRHDFVHDDRSGIRFYLIDRRVRLRLRCAERDHYYESEKNYPSFSVHSSPIYTFFWLS